MEQYTSKHGRWVTPIFFALAFYGFGAGMTDSFVIYPAWYIVGQEEFVPYHQLIGKKIQLFIVLPLLVMTVFTILMFWHRVNAIPKGLVWIALICTLIPWLSSAFIQIPIQIQLDHGKDIQLLDKLVFTDWLRVIPFFIQITTVFIMLLKSLAPVSSAQAK